MSMSVASDTTKNSPAPTIFTSSITSSVLANGFPGSGVFLESTAFSDEEVSLESPRSPFTSTPPFLPARPLLVDVPQFVHNEPSDPFSPIITIIAQSIEAHRIDVLFTQALIVLREELREVAQKYQNLKEVFDSVLASGETSISLSR
ncbi:hypothetical protein PC9H_011465 [Pleurotus ostreatus]|uniref:Uncharacterized protein n=1 Tax=Pleurotus ostreatus TaxID=5322 RepID=A0A8H6ZIQ5_PLEOS|nr:uncharacterized protein PC9H_011465 [Pleurotus ostreatus]KAF7420946.1 hypothetical protein PC9H_011465 [Pleurotus ostreatus]KAJ8690417.1 hypothetical protein PTI98_011845 [Pleurotus ostreatus]